MSAADGFSNGRGLHGQLVTELGRRIAAGELDPSEPLVPDEIGERFGVSRTVVRETLRVLQAKGMLRARQNVGTYIRPEQEWNLLDPDVMRWRLEGSNARRNMRDLVELRMAVEPQAAYLAATRASGLVGARGCSRASPTWRPRRRRATSTRSPRPTCAFTQRSSAPAAT